MNKLQAGLVEAIIGALMGLILNSVVKGFVQSSALPSYAIIILYLFNIVMSIATVIGLPKFGILYIIGWIFGSFIIKDILDPFDIFINIVVPIMILIIGIVVSIKKAGERY